MFCRTWWRSILDEIENANCFIIGFYSDPVGQSSEMELRWEIKIQTSPSPEVGADTTNLANAICFEQIYIFYSIFG